MPKLKLSIVLIGSLLLCLVTVLLTYFTLATTGVIETGKIDLSYQVSDKEIEYNGLSNTADEIALISGKLMKGDTANIEFIGQRVEIGSSSINARVTIFNSDGVETTNKYNISVIPGSLTITKRQITIKLEKNEKVYDGKPLYTKDFKDISNKLLKGHMIVPNYTTSSVNVNDNVYGEMIADIYDVYGRDVTQNYEISYNNTEAELKITKRPVTFTTLSLSKEYDGLAFDLNNYPESVKVSGLLDTDSYSINQNSLYMIKDAGTQANVISNGSVTIYDKDNNDVTSNYEIINRNIGVLTVTPCKLASEYKYPTITFNGKAQSLSFTLQNLLSTSLYDHFNELGYSVRVNNSQSYDLIDAGVYDYIIDFTIYDKAGNDVTKNFDKSSIDTSFKINPIDVIVKTSNINYEYNGSAFNLENNYQDNLDNYVTLTYDTDKNLKDLLDELEYEIELSYENYIEAGEYANIVDIKTTSNKLNKTSNFNFIYDLESIGKITISKREITITPKEINTKYTGFEIKPNDSIVAWKDTNKTGQALVNNHFIVAEYTGASTNVVENQETSISKCNIYDMVGNDVTNNYDIEFMKSSLTINPIDLTIHTKSEKIEYDGKKTGYKTKEEKNNISKAIGLLSNHYVIAKYKNSVSCDNTSIDNEIEELMIYDQNDIDISDNYNIIDYELGTLSLAPRIVEYTIKSKEAIYNGGFFKDFELEYSDDVLSADNPDISINYTMSDKIKNAGTYKNINLEFDLVFSNSDESYKSKFYEFVNTNKGVITIYPYDIYVSIPEDYSEEFNGQNVYLSYDFKADDSGVQRKTLGSDKLVLTADSYLTPNRSSINVKLISYDVLDTQGNSISENYKVCWMTPENIAIDENTAFENEYTLSYSKKAITFQGESITKTYSGNEFQDEFNVSLLNSTLPDGYYYNVTYSDDNQYVNVSSTAYDLDYEVTIYGNVDGRVEDVTDNYDVDAKPGSLYITPLKITITTLSTSYEYDGDTHEFEEAMISTNMISSTDLIFNSVGPEAGTYSNIAELDDDNYEITYIYGTITILPRQVSISTSAVSLTYGEDINSIALADYYSCDDAAFSANLDYDEDYVNNIGYTEAGDKFSIPLVYNGSDSRNYDYTLPTIDVVVDKAALVVNGSSLTATYTGYPNSLIPEDIEAKSDNGYTYIVNVTYISELTDVGEIDNIFIIDSIDGEDIENFNIFYNYGKIKVNKATLVVEGESINHTYDGSDACSADGYVNAIADTTYSYSVYLSYTTTQSDAGVYDNEFIVDSILGEDLSNFNIICKYGKIIIDKATITIKGLDYQAEYTGSDISCLYDNYDSISIGVNAEIEYTAQEINAGAYSNTFDVISIDGDYDYEKNYIVIKEYGILEITRVNLTINGFSKEISSDDAPINGVVETINVDGYEIEIEYTSIEDSIGTYPNTFKVISINGDADFNNNFNLTLIYNILTIN